MSNAVSRALLLVTTLVLAVACGKPSPPQDVTLAKKGTNGALVIAQDGRPIEGGKPLTDDGDAAVPVYTSDASLGNRDALVTLVEFSDLECPFCSRASTTVDALREAYGPDELRVVWKHYPLPFHKHAKPLSEAGAGVLELGGPLAFFRYQRAVFDSQGRVREGGGFDDSSARRFAEAVGIDGSVIEAGLRDGRWTGVVERDIALGRRVGVNGTPAFFVNGVKLEGAQPLSRFKEVVTDELAKAKELVAKGTPRDRVYVTASKIGFAAPKPDEDEGDEPVDTTVWNVPVDKSPALGPVNALVTVVEYSDFQCPFCKRVEPVLQRLRREYPSKVRIVWKDMPLPFHDRALPSAMLAREARAQKGDAGFWDVHDRLFDSQGHLDDADLLSIAKSAGLDENKVKRALAQKTHEKGVIADQDAGDDVGASGTPHFFVNGQRLVGSQPYEKFKALVDAELVKAEALVTRGTPASQVYAEIMKGAKTNAQAPVTKTVALDPQAPSRGAANAKVVIVQFSDFQCPFCKRVEPTMDDIMKAYPGKVRIEWRNLPLPMHPDAQLAAEAALEAKKQQGNAGFAKMHKLLFDGQTQVDGLKREALDGYARTLGLDAKKFAAALDNHVHLASIKADQAVAQAAGISGTPSFVVNGTYISGAQHFRKFRRVIEAELAKK